MQELCDIPTIPECDARRFMSEPPPPLLLAAGPPKSGGLVAATFGLQVMRVVGARDAHSARSRAMPIRLGPALLLVATACSGLPGTGHLDLQRARTQIDSLNAKFASWLAAEQLDSVAGIYAKDGVLMGPNALPVEGRTNIRAAWAAQSASHRLQFVLQTTDLLGGDSVLVERGRYALHIEPKAASDSAAAANDHGSYVVVWIHRESRWQIKFDIAASDKPAAAPAGASP